MRLQRPKDARALIRAYFRVAAVPLAAAVVLGALLTAHVRPASRLAAHVQQASSLAAASPARTAESQALAEGLVEPNLRRAPEVVDLERYLDAEPAAAAAGICHGGAPVLPGVPASVCADVRCLWSEALQAGVDMWDRPLAPLADQAGAATRCRRPEGGQAGPPEGSASPPLVSFVVTMHDGVGVAMRALLELHRTAHEVPSAEFILVDDGTTEDTEPIRRLLRALHAYFGASTQYLRNENATGFGAANERGIEAAGGQYIAIINSDLFVVRGWLTAIMRTFEKRPTAGIVGPLFFENDHKVHEAGSFVLEDGNPKNVGMRLPLGHQYTYLRPVDYVSAACAVFPKQLFQQLGGFDPQYGLGYYEDVDLAMRVRQAGREVLVQPLAVAHHQSGGTFGDDPTQSELLNALLLRNKRRFRDKWKAELEARHCKKYEEAVAAERRLTSPIVLLLAEAVPEPDADPGSARTLAAAHALLGAGYGVSLLPLARRTAAPAAEAAAREAGIHLLPSTAPQQLGWHAGDRGSCMYDVGLVARLSVLDEATRLMRLLCPGVPIIFDPGADFKSDAAGDNQTESWEAANLTLAASPEQAAELEARRPGLKVALVPDPVSAALLDALTEVGCGPLAVEERTKCRYKRAAGVAV